MPLKHCLKGKRNSGLGCRYNNTSYQLNKTAKCRCYCNAHHSELGSAKKTEDKYCVYAATKDIHQHAHSRQDILDKYGERIVMAERMPDVLSGAMGNEMYTAIVDSEAEVNKFADYVQEKA